MLIFQKLFLMQCYADFAFQVVEKILYLHLHLHLILLNSFHLALNKMVDSFFGLYSV